MIASIFLLWCFKCGWAFLNLVKLHEDDRAEDEDERGDQQEHGVQVDPSLVPVTPDSREHGKLHPYPALGNEVKIIYWHSSNYSSASYQM